MGCGSSAAALLAGVALANHFGGLGWSSQQILEEACRREGHPDNVAACWLGGMTASAMDGSAVITATCGQNINWRLMLALPVCELVDEEGAGLVARALTPARTLSPTSRIRRCWSSAFALDRPDLLRTAMSDRLHQPYRQQACPLLPLLLPLAGGAGNLWRGAERSRSVSAC